MRSLLSALTVGVLVAGCDGATAPSSIHLIVNDSLLPPELRAAYMEDASRLALRDLHGSGYSEIPIPQDAVEPYYAALVAVYSAGSLPARDSVVDVYRIHTFGLPETHSLLLQLLGTEPWVQRLARDEIPTGEPSIDTLLARYALSLGRVYALHEGDVLLTLESSDPLNINALAPLFSGIGGVRFAAPNGRVGDGNDIGGSIEESRVLLDYSVGYGDCPAGCIGRRAYHFAVHSDGTVDYLGASGSPPPAPGEP